MRLLRTTRLFLIFTLALAFEDCSDKCKVTSTYIYYVPVYSTSAEVKSAVHYESPRPVKSPGRIYFKDDYLYINEPGLGIHVIDNQNPASPVALGFISIPGSYDLAMVNNLLYADSFVDLVVFDVTDKAGIHEINRIERVFNHTQSYGFQMSSNNLVLTDWKEMKTVSMNESECEMRLRAWGGVFFEDGIAFNSMAATSGALSVGPSSTTGIGGSFARFTISNNTLYALDQQYLDVISLNEPSTPLPVKEINAGWDVETLFPYKDKLFAGSRTGMNIYDLQDPYTPAFISKYNHVMSCDPVVVDDSYAYVTLRSGNLCRAGSNLLEVIDITDLTAPRLVKSYPMTNPHGLGIDGKTLFICDGDSGLKVYDASNVDAIDKNQLANYTSFKAVDIIPFKNVAMMIAEDGLYQYDYSDVKNIHLMSKLAIAE